MKDRLDVVMEEKQGDSRLVNPEEDFKSLGDAEAIKKEVAPTMILEEQISQQLMPTTQQQKQKKS
jgi:hypothetical protein